MMTFTIIVLFGVIALTVTAQDVCHDHENAQQLSDLDRRSRNYSAANSADTHPILEDRWISSGDWFSTVRSGDPVTQYLMTDKTELPPVLHCGTISPIYLNGNHPDLQENNQVELEACVVDFFSHCYETKTVKIRRCGGWYQYQMEKSSANSAYCFENSLMTNLNNDPPDYTIPELKVRYELKYEKIGVVQEPSLIFACDFEILTDYFYRVDWYVNNQLIKETGPANHTELESMRLSESDLTDKNYTLGISIKCSARVSQSRGGLSTDAQFSEGFFAGVKVSTQTGDPAALNLEAGEEGDIVMANTVPVGSRFIQIVNKATEGAQVQMYDPTEDYSCTDASIAALGNLGDSAACGTTIPPFKFEDYMDAQNTTQCQQFGCTDYNLSNVTFKVATSGDATYGAKNTFTVQLRMSSDHKIWNDYKLPEIKVHVQDDGKWQRKKCSSHFDPHMSTADGVCYENQEVGTYLLYRNKKYDTEVQQKNTVACGRAVCTCSVIVRSGGDMFQINVCNKIRVIDYIACEEDQQVLDVRRITNSKYRITTPIGTYVEITILINKYLNIGIYMAPKDLRNVDGLCGDFNGFKEKDLRQSDGTVHADRPSNYHCFRFHPKDFTRSWRIEDQSFWLPQNQRPDEWKQNKTLCVCPYIPDNDKAGTLPIPAHGNMNTALCAPRALNCADRINAGNPSHVRQCHIRSKRRRRSVFTRSEESIEAEVLEKRSVSEETTASYEEGLQDCQAYIQGDPLITAYRGTLPDGESAVSQAMDECAADYQYNATDDSLKAGHLELAKSSFQNDILRNRTLQDDSPEIKTAFEAAYCPDDCSGHGTCSNGTCVCEEGFSGSACSDDPSQEVAVLEIEGGETCDLQDEDCDTLRVAAELVLEGFMCRIQETHKYIDSAEETVETYDAKGIFVSIYAGDCPLQTSKRRKRSTTTTSTSSPFFTIIDVSISNDGATFGGSERMSIYDSKCQAYTTTQSDQPTVSLYEGTCFIAGVCRSQGEVSTSDSCFACDPTSNAYNWTGICTTPAPTTSITTPAPTTPTTTTSEPTTTTPTTTTTTTPTTTTTTTPTTTTTTTPTTTTTTTPTTTEPTTTATTTPTTTTPAPSTTRPATTTPTTTKTTPTSTTTTTTSPAPTTPTTTMPAPATSTTTTPTTSTTVTTPTTTTTTTITTKTTPITTTTATPTTTTHTTTTPTATTPTTTTTTKTTPTTTTPTTTTHTTTTPTATTPTTTTPTTTTPTTTTPESTTTTTTTTPATTTTSPAPEPTTTSPTPTKSTSPAPEATTTSPTPTKTTSSTPEEPGNTEPLILGLSVTGAVILLLVIVAIPIAVIKLAKRRKRSPHRDSFDSPFPPKAVPETRKERMTEKPYWHPTPQQEQEQSTVSLHFSDPGWS